MRVLRPAVLLVSFVAACSDRAGNASGGEVGGTIVITTAGTGASSLIPPHASDVVGRVVADNVYERLAEIGPELDAVGDRGFTPRLARSWTWAPDSMSVAFAIDPRAKWHDGRPVRASDVKFSFDLIKDPKSATQLTSTIQNIDSVTVRDSLTAVAWFHKRTPEQFYDFAHQLFVMPEHVWKDIPRDKLATAEQAAHPVGSGRFRFARFDPGIRVELVADTAHYRGRPKLDRVIISFAADPGASLTQLFSGQADFMELVPVPAQPRLDSSATVRPFRYPSLGYFYLGMNQRDPKRLTAPHPVFGDVRVRRAVSMALDRRSMLRNVFDTVGILGSGPFSKTLADTTAVLPPFDRARAAALLDSAGWRAGTEGMRSKNGRPLAFGIIVPTSSAPRMRYAVLMQEQLKSIGARAEIESMDFRAFSVRQDKGDFDANLNGSNTDPTRSSVKQNWSIAGIPPAGQNFVRYTNRTFDALADSAAATFDPAKMNDYYHRAIQTLVDDAPAVWLYDLVAVGGAHKRIRAVGMRPDAWWAGLADWSIPANERIERDRIGLRPAQP